MEAVEDDDLDEDSTPLDEIQIAIGSLDCRLSVLESHVASLNYAALSIDRSIKSLTTVTRYILFAIFALVGAHVWHHW